MRLLRIDVLLTTVSLSVGKRLRAKSPAVLGRLALPETRICRLAAPPNCAVPKAASFCAKFRAPLRYVARAFIPQYLRRVVRLPIQPGFSPWTASARRKSDS